MNPPTAPATRAALAALLALLASCDKPAPSGPTAQVARGTASIRGTVVLIGTPPAMREITNRPCCAAAPDTVREETVVTDPATGGLANVFLYIKNAPPGSGANEPEMLLDQVYCRYVPHVVAVQVGQPLRIRSSDPIYHNVHFTPDKNEAQNLVFPDAGTSRVARFDHPEFIRLRCDVHSWMTAYVGVFANPFFAVTDDKGHYQITGLPPGNYTVATWHERYLPTEFTITVTDATVDAPTVEIRPPAVAPGTP